MLINTVSSAFDIVDSKTYKNINLIKNGELIQDEELIKTLKERGYIFKDKNNEIELIEKYARIHQKLIEKNLVYSFTICPTMGCNLRCTYCFEGNNNLSSKTIMTDGQLKSIFRFIDKCLDIDSNKKEEHSPLASI